jgi:hypothetical protein
MSVSVRIAPPNSLLLISEAPTTTGPSSLTIGARIGSTRTCIAVGCLAFIDGETRVALGKPIETNDRPAFDGYLDTPRRKVAVWTVEWKRLLETSVPTTRTRIRVWTNHPTEPDDVYVGVGEGT